MLMHLRLPTEFVAILLAVTLIVAAQESSPRSSVPGSQPGTVPENIDKAYRVGGHVKPPRPLYDPDPDYTDIARRVGYQGTVILWLVVDTDGLPKQIRLQQAIGMGLDEQAIEAVKKWRFKPGTKEGLPVPVMINVEVNFHLPVPGSPALHSPPESKATPPQFPGADTSKYPLVISIRNATGVPVGGGYEIRATANTDGTESPQTFSIFCSGSTGYCSFLGAGRYPARWLDGKHQRIEILGLENGGKEKWEKAQYTVGAALPAASASSLSSNSMTSARQSSL